MGSKCRNNISIFLLAYLVKVILRYWPILLNFNLMIHFIGNDIMALSKLLYCIV